MALKEEVYHVVHDKRIDRWRIEKAGSDRAIARADTKAEAVTIARKMGQGAELARVVVHRADGSIERTFSYGDRPNETPW